MARCASLGSRRRRGRRDDLLFRPARIGVRQSGRGGQADQREFEGRADFERRSELDLQESEREQSGIQHELRQVRAVGGRRPSAERLRHGGGAGRRVRGSAGALPSWRPGSGRSAALIVVESPPAMEGFIFSKYELALCPSSGAADCGQPLRATKPFGWQTAGLFARKVVMGSRAGGSAGG